MRQLYPLSTAMSTIHCVDLTPDRLPDYLAFFETRAFTDNPRWARCYCYFPLHDPTHTDWSQRTATENRRALCDSVASGSARGLLAYRDGKVVGWCSAGPWSQYPMLGDVDEPDAASLGMIFCFVVAPAQRGQGIASAMLDAACDTFKSRGFAAAVAKPRKAAQGQRPITTGRFRCS
jgi:ribosomal protein S18 acetylase RimI-like enzyme